MMSIFQMNFNTIISALVKKGAILLVFLGFIFMACEKDDICVDGDTPLLLITFYDADDPVELKEVQKLRVVGVGQLFTVNTFADRTSLDSIGIPLRPNEQSTSFLFIQNSGEVDNMETGNIDTLTFNYATNEVFISRACGFVANYEDLTDSLSTGSENWIQNIEIVRSSVQKLDSTHVKIFH